MQAFLQHQKFHIPSCAKSFYVDAMKCLDDAKIPFLVGGAYAFSEYSGIERPNHDFDIFVKKEDADRILTELNSKLGCMVHRIFPHWLYKAFHGEDWLDVIFCSGNGIATVDDHWFTRSKEATVLGHPARIIPAEELIWSKAFIMERERFDGADVAHTIRKCGPTMDWAWLIKRFDVHWRVLYSHIVLAGYIYPTDNDVIPLWVLEEFSARIVAEHKKLSSPSSSPSPSPSSSSSLSTATTTQEVDSKENIIEIAADTAAMVTGKKLCHGTFLSRQQYLKDLCEWDYDDGRIVGRNMTEQDVINWTAAALQPAGAGKS